MLSVHFPQDSLSRDAVHSADSSVLLIKIDCSSHINKHLTYLDNNFSAELILGQCIETVHMLICETQKVEFL